MRRLYTVAQANATLPYVSRIAADITSTYEEWHRKVAEFEILALEDEPEGGVSAAANAAQKRVQELAAEIDGFTDELAALGVECRGLEEGLLDFPAVVDGGDAWLCWRPGEPSVAWWHGREDGFAGRRSLADAEVLDPEAAGAVTRDA